jgi:membrane associated rhomboid family serine protease
MLRSCRNASTNKIYSTIMQRQVTDRLITMPKRILTNVRYFSDKRPWRVNNQRRDWSNNPIFQGQNVLYMIIGLNVSVYGIWQYAEKDRKLKQFMLQNFMLSSYGVLQQFRIHTLITSVFSHRDGWHLLSNMVTLYFFSQQSLSILGVSRYAFLYFGGGLVSSVCMVVWPYCIPNSFPSRYRTSTYQSALGELYTQTRLLYYIRHMRTSG